MKIQLSGGQGPEEAELSCHDPHEQVRDAGSVLVAGREVLWGIAVEGPTQMQCTKRSLGFTMRLEFPVCELEDWFVSLSHRLSPKLSASVWGVA